jgi:hypothetical protein
MSNDETQRGYPLPSPDNIAYDDAKRIRDAIQLINDDMTELDERDASEEQRGNVRLATPAEAAAGTALDRVPAVKRVKDMISAAITALQSWVSEQLADLETEFDQANADLEQAFAEALAGKLPTSAVGNGANKIVAFDADGKYPAADGSKLTNVVVKKNYIINGAMRICTQWAPGMAHSANAAYPVEQFQLALSAGFTGLTAQQVLVPSPAGSPNRLRFTATLADTNIAAGKYAIIQVPLEGTRTADLQFGTPNAKDICVRFGFKGPAGLVLSGSIKNGDNTRSRPFTFTCTGADQVVTVPMSGDQTGTWSSGLTRSLTLTIGFIVGSTFALPAGSWQNGGAFGATGTGNFMATSGNVAELFDVGLYQGLSAPPYAVTDYDDDIRECNRHCQHITQYIAAGYGTAANTIYSTAFFQDDMRDAPAVTFGFIGSSNAGATVLNAITNRFARLAYPVGSDGHAYTINNILAISRP